MESMEKEKGLFEGYLLVTDMDGTLLNGEKRISSENLAAIERFVEGGGRFTLATGRIVPSARPYAESLPVNAPAILYNGVMVYDYVKGEIVAESFLPQEARGLLTRVKETFPDIGIEIYPEGEDAPYFLQDNAVTERHRRIEGFSEQPVASVDEVPDNWRKVLLAWEPELLDGVVEAIRELTGEVQVEWLRSDDKYFEMLPAASTKGHALEKLMESLEIPRERCIALGDHLNDLEMIRRAGVGVAVANAHPLLLQDAGRHGVHHDEHALAEIIGWLEQQIRDGLI